MIYLLTVVAVARRVRRVNSYVVPATPAAAAVCPLICVNLCNLWMFSLFCVLLRVLRMIGGDRTWFYDPSELRTPNSELFLLCPPPVTRYPLPATDRSIMFTGIVEATGKVERLEETGVAGSFRLRLETRLAAALKIGDSLAVNGCCLTAAELRGETIRFDLLAETLRRTNLGALRPGSLVNLERPMAADGRFDGHLVQGHVDTAAEILAIEPASGDHRVEIALPAAFARYVVFKGSIAVNGISLTVAELLESSFVLWIIPHTWEVTNLRALKPRERVNLEFDLVAKYVERMMAESLKAGRV